MFQSLTNSDLTHKGFNCITEALRGHDQKEIPVCVISGAESLLWVRAFSPADSVVLYICHVQETTQCTITHVVVLHIYSGQLLLPVESYVFRHSLRILTSSLLMFDQN